MNKEELENYIKTNVPKLIIDNVKCEAVSAYGSINVDELTTAIDRLKKVPNYDDLLKENNKLSKALLDIKEYIDNHQLVFELSNLKQTKEWFDELYSYVNKTVNKAKEMNKICLARKN